MESVVAHETTAQRVVQGLAKIGLVIRQHAWRKAGGRNLTPTQAQVLSVLNAAPSAPGLTEVADALAITPATASDSVRVLVDKGLVRKERSNADRRAVRLKLTASGRSEARRLAGWPELLTGVIDELDGHERALFLRALVKMIRGLQERRAIPVQRMCVDCQFFAPNVYDDTRNPHHCHYVNKAFSDGQLRLDCPDHTLVDPGSKRKLYELFVQGRPVAKTRGRDSTLKRGVATQ